MSSLEHPSGSLAPLDDKLNARELEVLRLLTAGHTVKSIAARLGRSEASINERLREARRKTGVGSSRELARLLDTQKIWDKNIDLPGSGPSIQPEQQPQTGVSSRSKGSLFMLIAMPLAAIGLALTATNSAPQVAVPVTAQAVAGTTTQSPLVGRWSLDLARIPAEERPRSVILEFRRSPDDLWMGIVDIVGPDGSVQHAQSAARMDGVPVSLEGSMQFADTVSMRQPEPNTLVMTFAKAGAPVSTRVYTVTKDRKSMTETIVWASAVEPRMVTTYFNRID